MKREKLKFEIRRGDPRSCKLKKASTDAARAQFPWNRRSWRVRTPSVARASPSLCRALEESGCLGMQLKMGGKFHLKLNIGERPIANK